MSSPAKSFRKFTIIWFGQFVSMLGSGLSSFGLSVWIFNETHSAMNFAMTFFVNILPGILFAPFAGTLADRRNRKLIMILTDSLDALTKVILCALWLSNHLSLPLIYCLLFFSATVNTLQGPAFIASVPEIVPKEKLGRANGMLQMISAIRSMLAPLIAGALYPFVHFGGLLLIDIATYVVGISTIAFQSIPQPEPENKTFNLQTVFDDFRAAYSYLRAKPGFLTLIWTSALLNFAANFAIVLLGPLILSRYDSLIYGTVNSISGVAMIIGSVLAGLFPAKSKRARATFLSLILSSCGLVIMGFSPLWGVVALGFFIFILPVPYANSQMMTILQNKIDGYIFGRVTALMQALMMTLTPIAVLSSGFLADEVFNPLLAEGGAWSQTWIAALIGVGKTRGSGLMFILSGALLLLICVLCLLNRTVARMEEVNPDVIKEDSKPEEVKSEGVQEEANSEAIKKQV